MASALPMSSIISRPGGLPIELWVTRRATAKRRVGRPDEGEQRSFMSCVSRCPSEKCYRLRDGTKMGAPHVSVLCRPASMRIAAE